MADPERAVDAAPASTHGPVDTAPAEPVVPAGGAGTAAPPAPERDGVEATVAEEDDLDADAEDDLPAGEVQLGFAEPLEPEGPMLRPSNTDWENWNGGKLGGRPFWLDSAALPAPAALRCARCEQPLALIVQIYAPLEEEDCHHSEAFHRMLYLFACRNGSCTQRGSALALRCQLPERNAFLPRSSGDPAPASAAPAPTCAVCGIPCDPATPSSSSTSSSGVAADEPPVLACCASHAAAARVFARASRAVASAPKELSTARVVKLGFVFQESDLVNEDEPEAKDDGLEGVLVREGVVEDLASGSEDPSIATLTQAELNEALGSQVHADKTMQAFLLRVQRSPAQCVRYALWNQRAPLWYQDAFRPSRAALLASPATAAATPLDRLLGPRDLSSPGWAESEPLVSPTSATSSSPSASSSSASSASSPCIPACPRCGAPRAFEFQVLPQVLSFLQVDRVAGEAPRAVLASSSAAAAAAAGGGGGAAAESSPDALAASGARIREALKTDTLDFGTLVVFTCSRSCGFRREREGPWAAWGGYTPEFVWVQPAEKEEGAAAKPVPPKPEPEGE